MEYVNSEDWLYVKDSKVTYIKGYVGRVATGDNRLNSSLGVLT